MGQTKTFPPVKLIAAITVAKTSNWDLICDQLEQLYSKIDYQIEWYSFDHTEYYQDEMGKNLSKKMVSFNELIWAEKLVDIKLSTNNLENNFLVNGKRKVNIDPGYLNASKVVLATTKDYSHRIYLGRGIFGDVHLKYQKHQFQANEWTYPDYKEPFVIDFFEEVRNQYMTQLSYYKF